MTFKFSKGYTPNWLTELFTTTKVLNTNLVIYQLKDELNNTILGCFNEEEITKTNFPNTFFIKHILKRNKNKMYVKLMCHHSSCNSLIEKNNFDLLLTMERHCTIDLY